MDLTWIVYFMLGVSIGILVGGLLQYYGSLEEENETELKD